MVSSKKRTSTKKNKHFPNTKLALSDDCLTPGQKIIIVKNNLPNSFIHKLYLSENEFETRSFVAVGSTGTYIQITTVGKKPKIKLSPDRKISNKKFIQATKKLEQGASYIVYGLKLDNQKTVWCLRNEFALIKENPLSFCSVCPKFFDKAKNLTFLPTRATVMTKKTLNGIISRKKDALFNYRKSCATGIVRGEIVGVKEKNIIVSHETESGIINARYDRDELTWYVIIG